MIRLFFVCLLAQYANAANILGIFTSDSPSHITYNKAIADELIYAGHNLTIVSYLPMPGYRNFTHILLDQPEYEQEFSKVQRNSVGLGTYLRDLYLIMRNQREVLQSERFSKMLNESSFDLVILGYYYNNFMLAVPAQLKVPVILTWPDQPNSFMLEMFGNDDFYNGLDFTEETMFRFAHASFNYLTEYYYT